MSEDGQLRLAELAARLGIECFVMDDGWFGGRDNDRAGLGDWTVNREKFPRGLGPLIGRVNDLGMRFGLWVEPEMVNPDSDLYRSHPDWVYHFAGRTRSQYRNQLVLNLARPDVAEWVFATLDRLLSENHIEFVKWDMNRPFSEPGWPAQAGRDPERIWTDHVRSLYTVIDRLRAAHPGVDFESCSGGGGRVDLGILRRVEQVWPSDNTDAWDRVTIQEGFTQVYPPQVMSAWVTDSPNFLTGRELPLSFRFHVAMAGALGVGGDLLRWTDRGTGRGGGADRGVQGDPPGHPARSAVPARLGAGRAVRRERVHRRRRRGGAGVVGAAAGRRPAGSGPAGRPGRRRPLPGHRLRTAALGLGADGGGPGAPGGVGQRFRQRARAPGPGPAAGVTAGRRRAGGSGRS